MDIGKIEPPKGNDDSRLDVSRTRDAKETAQQGAVDNSGLIVDQDSVSISGDALTRTEEVAGLAERVQQQADVDSRARQGRLAEVQRRVEGGSLARPEVLEKTAERILDRGADLPDSLRDHQAGGKGDNLL